MLWLRRPVLICLVAMAAVGAVGRRRLFSADASGPSEYQVKAAYLYNFGRYVEWPQDNGNPRASEFAICVLGSDPFGTILDTTIAGEKIEGMKVVAKRLSKVEEATGCRVLFVSPSEGGRLKEVLSTLGKSNILTVSDLPQFIKTGGMVQFVLMGERVRFEINVGATHYAGLSLSSELLKVAANIRQGPRPGE